MTDNYIQINDDDILVLKIKKNGEDTGEELRFDLNDIEFPLRYQEMLYKINKNKEKLKNDFVVIDRRPDIQGKKLFSKNAEDKLKAFNDFTNKMVEAYNMFLGENGVQKLLCGKKVGWTTLSEIDDIIDKQIAPLVLTSFEDIEKKIIDKYSFKGKEEL